MKNFPSALIKQKNTKQGLGNNLGTTLKNIGAKALKNLLSGNDDSEKNLSESFDSGYEILELGHEFDNLNINKHSLSIKKQMSGNEVDKRIYDINSNVSLNANINNGKTSLSDCVVFEDPFLFSSSIFSVINNYKYILKSSLPSIQDYAKLKDDGKGNKNADKNEYALTVAHSIVAPSLFNPYYGVSITGITEHVPLMLHGNSDLNGSIKIENPLAESDKKGTFKSGSIKKDITLSSTLPGDIKTDEDISDCTIKKLVELSNQPAENRELGLATYRYADFMFCKDLGKISNNHLITLRKFPGPIGDNIFKGVIPKGKKDKNKSAGYPDIGRMITWFGNEDNKLEDICRFNYNATWKEFTAEIKQENSQQQDEGLLDKIANSLSPQNNKLVGEGFSSNTGLLGWGAGLLDIPILSGDHANNAHYDLELLSNYDQHRIYTPQNTIWDTHKYEGKLVFNQEITLTFRYTLRSYANINPKSAFLDLIGNIMAVTYRRGSFWGGESKIIGPQGNNSVYETAYGIADNAFEKLGGIWNNFVDGNFSLGDLQGWLGNVSNLVGGLVQKAKDTVQGAVNPNATASQKQTTQETKKNAKKVIKKGTEMAKQYGWANALKGMFKNQLGRPAMYAFNSLLTGEAVGPWHLTIGNPRNPIMSMGNMIMTGSEVQQSGPLGIDDFPTELKVTVQLKHGRPRDSVEIQKMYTKGTSAIYRPMNLIQLDKYKNNPYAFGDIVGTKSDKDTLQVVLANI